MSQNEFHGQTPKPREYIIGLIGIVKSSRSRCMTKPSVKTQVEFVSYNSPSRWWGLHAVLTPGPNLAGHSIPVGGVILIAGKEWAHISEIFSKSANQSVSVFCQFCQCQCFAIQIGFELQIGKMI